MSRLVRLFSACTVSAIALGALTGCGMGAVNYSVPDINYVATPMHGVSMGGNMPILNETVSVYVTSSAGYGTSTHNGGNAWQQQTTSNAVTGAWSFAGGYNCPAGQYVYIVGTGGNTGANATNNNAVLVAALGRCDDLFSGGGSSSVGPYAGGGVVMNELGTIAAAYALGAFSNVTGSGAGTVVQIGATPTNNAPELSSVSTGCVTGVGSCGGTTSAAGLYHAFLNAANLVNVFSIAPSANSTITAANGAIVPQQLINSIANSLVACVNSAGGAIGDGSACGTLLDLTSLPSGHVASWTSATPTNTFSAMVNLAANPTLSGVITSGSDCTTGTKLACLFNMATPSTNVYSPVLSTSTGINDYSIAISYPPTGTFSSISFPMTGAMDINDNYYVGNATYNTASAGKPTTPVNVLSFSSNGATFGSSTAAVAGVTNALGLSVDAKGDGYFGNGGTSANPGIALFPFANGVTSSTAIATGSVVTSAHSGLIKVYATAVDQANNIWAWGPQQTNGLDNLYKNPGPYTVTTNKTWVAQNGPVGAITVPTAGQIGMSIDPNQNIWATVGTTLYILENNGSVVTSPTYTISAPSTTTSGSPAVGVAFAVNGGSYKAWISSYNTTPGIQAFTPTFDTNGFGVNGVTPAAISQPSSITGTFFNEADGAGSIWVADTNTVSIQQYNTGSGTAYKFLPCLGGSTTCSTAFVSPGKPLTLSIDSTGSIWVAIAASGSSNTTATPGNIVQIIGSAAPTWPLLSLGKLGMP